MPFVPLGQRKPIPLVLDADKEHMKAVQQARDFATMQAHSGVAPGASGYRFANHPLTKGPVRGPDVPFRRAHAPWQPPQADPEGPAAERDREQASCGAYWEGSHDLRRVQSTPCVAGNAMEACHPLSMELRRWEKLAATTRRNEAGGKEPQPPDSPKRRPEPEPEAAPGPRQGLVLFPRYMLINNCHLKSTDLQRFQRQQQEEQRRALQKQAERALLGEDAGEDHQQVADVPRGPMKFEASWGAPKLKTQSLQGPHWAGNPLPQGRAQRTSNPLVTG